MGSGTLQAQTTLVVNSLLDNTSPGTLRWAVGVANGASGAADMHEIVFSGLNIGDQIDIDDVLQVTGDFITINGDINGDFQPDIIINASNTGISGFEITGTNNLISYLNIVGFSTSGQSAIVVQGADNRVFGNYLGTDITGSGPSVALNSRGVSLEAGSGHLIGDGTAEHRNIIGNNTIGIFGQGASNCSILGNHIGVGRDGSTGIQNGGAGIELVGTLSIVIGGPGAGEGNVVSGNDGTGILLSGTDMTRIEGNFIGTDANGLSGLPNNGAGVTLGSANKSSTILGNVISGNTGSGIVLNNSTLDRIFGNFIGVDLNGLNAVPNNSHGIQVGNASQDANIGDGSAANRNIISGNSGNGILVEMGPNTILGNYIGTDLSGNSAVGNGGAGVVITGGSNTFIGGPGLGNVISGNNTGIAISSPTQRIIGNKIGTNESGTASVPNATDGIRLTGATQAIRIGDGSATGYNLIAGNNGNGIVVDGAGINSVLIQENYIGVQADGVSLMGNNGNGILFVNGPQNNNVWDNVIADNNVGILLDGSSTNFNNLFANSIFMNAGKGIELINGAQGGAVPPVITSIQPDGTITGTAAANARVDLFLDSDDEGQYFLRPVFADPGGNWVSTIFPSDIPDGSSQLTATQIPNGITSEFSPATEVLMAYTVINTNDSGPGSLRWVLNNTNSNPDFNDVIFDIPPTDPNYTNAAGDEFWTIFPSTELPQIIAPVQIDGNTQSGNGPFRIRLDGQGSVGIGLYFAVGGNRVFSMFLTGFDSGATDDAALLFFHLAGGSSTIGAAGRGNVLNGSRNGLRIMLANGMIIQSNLIGTDITGTTAVPNIQGISLPSGSAGNTIGGLNASEGNLISGNTNQGIFINTGANQIIANNLIGTDMTGLNPLPNTIGIQYSTSGNMTITDNTISGNTQAAIQLSNANDGRIYGNRIGVGLDGTTPIGNGMGIRSIGAIGVDNNRIGGTFPVDANIIAYNTGAGISLEDERHDFNTIVGNQIFCNGGRGIELNLDQPSSKHGNDGIPSPIIGAMSLSSVSGSGTDGDQIDLYRDNSTCLPAQGSEYLGSAIVTGGTWSVTGITVGASDVITATATDTNGNTSQFTEPEITVFDDGSGAEILDGQVEITDMGTGYFGSGLSYSVSVTNDGTMPLSLFDVSSSSGDIMIANAPSFIYPGDTELIDLLVDGQTVGSFSTDIIITTDDFDEPAFTFPVDAEILDAADIHLFLGPDISGTELLSGQPTPIDFGSATEGSDITLEFTIRNAGTIDLSVADISSDITEYIVSNVPSIIPVGSTATFEVILYEAPVGVHDGVIAIANSDPDNGNFTFDVTGEITIATLPDMSVYHDTGSGNILITDQVIDLGQTILGQDLVGEFVIANDGDADLILSAITSSDLEFTVENAPGSVPALTTEPFQIRLDGSGTGVFNATILVESNDPNRPSFPFGVRGEVLAGGLTLKENNQNGTLIEESTPVDVGTTPPSATIEKVFVIENPGSTDLIITSIVIDNEAFSLDNIPGTIGPGSFDSFTVLFNTGVLGPHQGTVIIESNIGTFTFFVTGNIVNVQVFNAVSPNNDGVHDFLKIENVEFFESNTVVIYTRWGDKVFEMENYDNANRVFDGNANTGRASLLPDGTYYYVLTYKYSDSFGKEIATTLTGFFLIRR